jgi:hypothetical protein
MTIYDYGMKVIKQVKHVFRIIKKVCWEYDVPERSTRRRYIQSSKATDALGSWTLANLENVLITNQEKGISSMN